MLTKYTSKLAELLIEHEINEREDKDILIYGLTTACRNAINVSTTILLGSLFHLLLESLLFMFFFSFVRIYAGGFHCKNATCCYCASSALIGLVLAIVKWTPQDDLVPVGMFMLAVSLPILIRLAPIETQTKPFDPIEQHYFRAKTLLHLALECALILFLLCTRQYRCAYLICFGIFSAAVLVLLGRFVER